MIVSELRHKFPLKALLKLSGLARSTYYCYLKQQGTDKYCVVKQKIEKIFTENKQRYGYRRILLVLRLPTDIACIASTRHKTQP